MIEQQPYRRTRHSSWRSAGPSGPLRQLNAREEGAHSRVRAELEDGKRAACVAFGLLQRTRVLCGAERGWVDFLCHTTPGQFSTQSSAFLLPGPRRPAGSRRRRARGDPCQCRRARGGARASRRRRCRGLRGGARPLPTSVRCQGSKEGEASVVGGQGAESGRAKRSRPGARAAAAGVVSALAAALELRVVGGAVVAREHVVSGSGTCGHPDYCGSLLPDRNTPST